MVKTKKQDNLWIGTLAEYEAMEKHDVNVTYIITDDTEVVDIINDRVISDKSTWSSERICTGINEKIHEIIPDTENKVISCLVYNGEEYLWRDIDALEKDIRDAYGHKSGLEDTNIPVEQNLVLGASGIEYEFKTPGYIILSKYSSAKNQELRVYDKDNNRDLVNIYSMNANEKYTAYFRVSPDSVLRFYYTFGGETVTFKYIRM